MHKRSSVFAVVLLYILLAGLASSAQAHTDVTPQEAQQLIDSNRRLIIVDVREETEFCGENGHIPGAVNYPLNSGVLQERYDELPADGDILVVCQSGHRSDQAAAFLDSQGFTGVYDMLGGMSAWEGSTETCKETDPCPAEVALGDQSEKLGLLRRFRDEVLLQTRAGAALTLLYYYYAPHLSTFLAENTSARERAREVVERFVPLIRAQLETK